MWNVKRIIEARDAMQGKKKEMQGVLDKVSAEIAQFEADGTRHPDWIRERTAEARGKAFSALGPPSRFLSEQAAAVKAQARFWESRNLLLSLEKFDEDPVKDSAIRQRYRGELNALSNEELHLVADHARDDGNLPLLWQAHLAGRRFADVKGATGIDISDVKVPGQDEALQAIRECGALLAGGDFIVGQTSGRVNPTRKLTLGRAMAQPSENKVPGAPRYGDPPTGLEKLNAEPQEDQQET
jgi:hypothetical protein